MKLARDRFAVGRDETRGIGGRTTSPYSAGDVITAPWPQDQARGLDHRAIDPHQSGAWLKRRDHRFLILNTCLDATLPLLL